MTISRGETKWVLVEPAMSYPYPYRFRGQPGLLIRVMFGDSFAAKRLERILEQPINDDAVRGGTRTARQKKAAP